MTSEAAIQQQVRLALAGAGSTVFRNNIGAYTDPKSGRVIKYGVCHPGGSDLIGWTPVTITPDMVGQTVALFTAVECKTKAGIVTPAQLNFIAQVLLAGGLAGIARSPDDVAAILRYQGFP